MIIKIFKDLHMRTKLIHPFDFERVLITENGWNALPDTHFTINSYWSLNVFLSFPVTVEHGALSRLHRTDDVFLAEKVDR
jgi:hypothetical protein